MDIKFFFSTLFFLLCLPLVAAAGPVAVGAVMDDPLGRVSATATTIGVLASLVTQLLRSSAFAGRIQSMSPRLRILIPIGLVVGQEIAAQWLTGMSLKEAGWSTLFACGIAILKGEGLYASIMGIRTGAKTVPVDTSVKPLLDSVLLQTQLEAALGDLAALRRQAAAVTVAVPPAATPSAVPVAAPTPPA